MARYTWNRVIDSYSLSLSCHLSASLKCIEKPKGEVRESGSAVARPCQHYARKTGYACAEREQNNASFFKLLARTGRGP